MNELAGWIAPAATMIAAMMTAANLGARVTGWGFVVFTVGSIAWSVVAITSDQDNLLYTNVFLTIVNLVGIYRWLGREAVLADGQARARAASHDAPSPALFPLATLEHGPLVDAGGATIGQAVGAMARCGSGAVAYVVVRIGDTAGVGGTLHALRWDELRVEEDRLATRLTRDAILRLPEVEPACWPSETPPRG